MNLTTRFVTSDKILTASVSDPIRPVKEDRVLQRKRHVRRVLNVRFLPVGSDKRPNRRTDQLSRKSWSVEREDQGTSETMKD